MTAVAGIDVDVVTRRVTKALSERPELMCPAIDTDAVVAHLADAAPPGAEVDVRSVCVGLETCARFVETDAGVAYRFPLHVDIVFDVGLPPIDAAAIVADALPPFAGALAELLDWQGLLPDAVDGLEDGVSERVTLRCDVAVLIALSAQTVDGGASLRLTGAFTPPVPGASESSVTVTCHGPHSLAPLVEGAVLDGIADALQDVPDGDLVQSVGVPLEMAEPLVGVDPVVALRVQDGRAQGSTLVLGVGDAQDGGVDVASFVAADAPMRAPADWSIEVDEAALRRALQDMAVDELSDVRLPTGIAGQVVRGVLSIIDHGLYWGAGDPPDAFSKALSPVFGDHMLWLVVEATFDPEEDDDTDPDFEVSVRVYAYADLRVVEDGLAVSFYAQRVEVGADGSVAGGDASFDLAFAAEFVAEADADSDGELDFEFFPLPRNVLVMSADDLPGGDGGAAIAFTSVTAWHDRLVIAGRELSAPFAGPPSTTEPTGVTVTNERRLCESVYAAEAAEPVTFPNLGGSPLFLCDVSVPDGAPFEIDVPGGLPMTIEPGENRGFQVQYTGEPGTSVETSLTVRTNDCALARMDIALSGEKLAEDAYHAGAEHCVGDPAHDPDGGRMAPRGWFEGMGLVSKRLAEELADDEGLAVSTVLVGLPSSATSWTSSENAVTPATEAGRRRILTASVVGGREAPTYHTSAEAWASAPSVDVTFHADDVVATVKGERAEALHRGGPVVVAQHRSHADVYVVRGDGALEHASRFDLAPGAALGLVGTVGWLADERGLRWLDLGDPRRPGLSEPTDVGARRARRVDGGVALVSARDVEFVSLRSGTPRVTGAWSLDDDVVDVEFVDGALVAHHDAGCTALLQGATRRLAPSPLGPASERERLGAVRYGPYTISRAGSEGIEVRRTGVSRRLVDGRTLAALLRGEDTKRPLLVEPRGGTATR